MIKKLQSFSIVILVLVIALLVPTRSYAKQTTIYYYFPDSPVSNLSQLKTNMEAMFAASNIDIVFQPFSRFRDFESQRSKVPPDLIISQIWNEKNEIEFDDLLKAYRDGKPTYKKLLITSNSLAPTQSPQNKKTIALTALGGGY